MGEKVKVSEKLYEALEYCLNGSPKEILMNKHAEKWIKGEKWIQPIYKPFNEMSIDDMAKVLYQGYEVEETPEEKLIRKYNEFYAYIGDSTDNFENGLCTGIEFCLDILGVKIEGINK